MAYVLALDEGTIRSRAMMFDAGAGVCAWERTDGA